MQIGGEDDVDAVVAAALTELSCLQAAGLGELAFVPARCDPELVVDARRMRLEDDRDTHARNARAERNDPIAASVVAASITSVMATIRGGSP